MAGKIAFALSSFYPDHRAGTETYVLNLSKELINMGYKVSVITPAVGKPSSNYTYEGISVYTFSVPLKVSTKELNGLVKPSGLDEFKQLLQQIKPAIFHLHSLGRSMHAEHLKLASEMGIKTLFTAHLGNTFCVKGNLLLFGKEQCNGLVKKQRCLACFVKDKAAFSNIKSKLSAFIINQILFNSPFSSGFPAYHIVKYKLHQLSILRKYSVINIAIAGWINQVYKANGFANIKTIPQGIDSLFVKEVIDLDVSDKQNLIFVGRMHPDKGVHLLIEALESVSAEYFNLIIITIPFEDEMEYYTNIKKRYYQLGYANWFEKMPPDEVSKKMDKASVLILPSTRNEAAPLVILEAFAKKIPVIGSDFIAIQEMVQHNVNGLLFKNGDPESLRQQLLRLLNEPELMHRLKQNIGPVRSFKEVAREHDEIYKAIN